MTTKYLISRFNPERRRYIDVVQVTESDGPEAALRQGLALVSGDPSKPVAVARVLGAYQRDDNLYRVVEIVGQDTLWRRT